MIRLAPLLTLLALASGCVHSGYRHRAAPGVTVVPEETAAKLGQSKGTITILRKKLVDSHELVDALMKRAKRGERRYLSGLLLQWIRRVDEHAVYCQARFVPEREADRGALRDSVARTAAMDRMLDYRAAALLHYRHQLAPEAAAESGTPAGWDLGRKPDLSFVSRNGWELNLKETQCKVGAPAPHDQVTLAAEAY